MRAVEQARSKLAAEINIVAIVKSRRVIKRALQHLLSKEKYAKLEEEAEYLYIKDSEDDACDDESVV